MEADAAAPDAAGSDTPDAALLDAALPEAQTREAAECEMHGGSQTSVMLETNYFESCTQIEGMPDRAFVWTAPSSAFYQVSMTRGTSCYGAAASLEVRRGGCSNERADSQALCAATRADEDGCPPHTATFLLEEGESLMAIVEGHDWFLNDDPVFPLRQSLGLEITELTCPKARALREGEFLSFDALPSTLPVREAFDAYLLDPIWRDTACSFDVPSRRQAALAWTAPSSGVFRFSVNDEAGRGIALALLDGTCTGEELACDGVDGEGLASIEHALNTGETLVLLIELHGLYDDTVSYEVAIDAVDVPSADGGA
jgi:hypothetical protein